MVTLQGSSAPSARGKLRVPSSIGLFILASAGTLAACGGTLSGSEEGTSGPSVVGEDDIPSDSTRFRRLTHSEWRKTTIDLFGLSPGDSLYSIIESAVGNFRNDPVQGGYLFDGNAESLDVDSLLWNSYNGVAREIAAAFVLDTALMNTLVPSGGTDTERAREFITQFGERVHRRPLDSTQVDTYLDLFTYGTTSYSDTPGFAGGIRVLLEGLLQSPFFIYRIEASDEVSGGMIPLDGYERAARLSYFFWGTMPDDALFAAAEAGELDSADGVRAQAARLIADPRASESIVNFFEKLMDVEKYENIAPSANAFPDLPSTFAESLAGETRSFVEGELFEKDGGVLELLTSTTGYVNADLAPIYGLDGSFDADFQQVGFDPNERSGIFTQAGFLAVNATSSQPDPIHRGVFVAKRINCIKIAAPPDNVPPLPTPDGQSNRQLVEEHTEAEGTSCRNCHSTIINPFGFAYEHYDAIGAYRTMDGPHQVDAASEAFVGGELTYVENAIDLARLMAESAEVHECISSHLVAFAQGRNVVPEDEKLISDLGAASLGDGSSFKQLMIEMATADSFLNRPKEAK